MKRLTDIANNLIFDYLVNLLGLNIRLAPVKMMFKRRIRVFVAKSGTCNFTGCRLLLYIYHFFPRSLVCTKIRL